MRGKRLFQTLRLFLTLSPHKRTKYLKEQKVFAAMGENCSIMDRKVPLYANLIKLGNNVHLASNVHFVTHDITHVMLNGIVIPPPNKNRPIKEKIGCIEIGNNVFIGSYTTILSNVKIGSNVIIGACTLVNKDIPDNSVVAGIPAKVIGTFNDFLQRRLQEEAYPDEFHVKGEAVDEGFADWLWHDFDLKHNNN